MRIMVSYKDNDYKYSFRLEKNGHVWLDIKPLIFEGEETESLICPSLAVAYDTMIVLSTGKLSRTF